MKKRNDEKMAESTVGTADTDEENTPGLILKACLSYKQCQFSSYNAVSSVSIKKKKT